MTAARRKLTQLSVAAIFGAVACWLLTVVNDAAMQMLTIMRFCWPATVQNNGINIPTDNFWRNVVATTEPAPGPVHRFFLLSTHHHLLMWAMIVAAVLGWAGSIFLRVLRAETKADRDTVPEWDGYVASLVLAMLGALLLYLLTMAARAPFNDESNCLPDWLAYLATAGALLCGLFVVLFYKFAESIARTVWGRATGMKPGDDSDDSDAG